MMRLNTSIINSIILIAITTLSGCGGGSGNSDTSAPPPTPKYQVSGSASKGILSQANVQIWHIQQGIKRDSASYQTTTDENGLFKITHEGSNTGLYFIEITAKPDSTSLMQCDLILCGQADDTVLDLNQNGLVDFGEQMPMPEKMVLSGYFPAPFNSKKLNVNILTHLTATQFEKIPTSEDLSNFYLQLKNELNLANSPEDIEAFDLTNLQEVEHLSDNLLSLALLSTPNSKGDIVASISLLENKVKNSGKLFSDNFYGEYWSQAMSLSQKLEAINSESQIFKEVTKSIKAKNKTVVKDLNVLSMEQLPISMPAL